MLQTKLIRIYWKGIIIKGNSKILRDLEREVSNVNET